ncbi:hypothetical protein H5410_018496 [Solanum commersonii]|uniref:Uncharacterized protein n=1 Tax=Solanum commersonii TaxID=4109 RepID=A0A9J6A2L2_SOLCO|nr:hypothetical protein H5410_018496 [Solanum commersonii]
MNEELKEKMEEMDTLLLKERQSNDELPDARRSLKDLINGGLSADFIIISSSLVPSHGCSLKLKRLYSEREGDEKPAIRFNRRKIKHQEILVHSNGLNSDRPLLVVNDDFSAVLTSKVNAKLGTSPKRTQPTKNHCISSRETPRISFLMIQMFV